MNKIFKSVNFKHKNAPGLVCRCQLHRTPSKWLPSPPDATIRDKWGLSHRKLVEPTPGVKLLLISALVLLFGDISVKGSSISDYEDRQGLANLQEYQERLAEIAKGDFTGPEEFGSNRIGEAPVYFFANILAKSM